MPDELTVHLPMKPDSTAFGLMGRSIPIMPKHIIEEIGDEEYNNTGGGSGPFQLESYDPGDVVRSSRFEGYHVEAGSTHRIHKPYIKEMVQIVRPESLSRVAALEAGEADLAVGLPPELVETFVDSDDFRVESDFGPNNHHIGFNTLRPLADGSTPFQDIRVRRAMNHRPQHRRDHRIPHRPGATVVRDLVKLDRPHDGRTEGEADLRVRPGEGARLAGRGRLPGRLPHALLGPPRIR